MENIDFLMKLPIFYNLKNEEIINILNFFNYSKEDFEKITRGINGGTNGIADRRKKLNVAKSVYKPVKPGDNNSLLA